MDLVSPGYIFAGYMGYSPSKDQMSGGYFALSTAKDCCMLTTDDQTYYIGSVDPAFDSKTILDTFPELVN